MKDSSLFRYFSLPLVIHFFILLACLTLQVTPLKKTPALTVDLYSVATWTAIEPQNENGSQAEKTLPLQPQNKVQKNHPSRARKSTESQPAMTELAPAAASTSTSTSTSARLKQHLPSKQESTPRKATAQFPLEPQPVSGQGEAVKSKQHQEMVSLPVDIENSCNRYNLSHSCYVLQNLVEVSTRFKTLKLHKYLLNSGLIGIVLFFIYDNIYPLNYS